MCLLWGFQEWFSKITTWVPCGILPQIKNAAVRPNASTWEVRTTWFETPSGYASKRYMSPKFPVGEEGFVYWPTDSTTTDPGLQQIRLFLTFCRCGLAVFKVLSKKSFPRFRFKKCFLVLFKPKKTYYIALAVKILSTDRLHLYTALSSLKIRNRPSIWAAHISVICKWF